MRDGINIRRLAGWKPALQLGQDDNGSAGRPRWTVERRQQSKPRPSKPARMGHPPREILRCAQN